MITLIMYVIDCLIFAFTSISHNSQLIEIHNTRYRVPYTREKNLRGDV